MTDYIDIGNYKIAQDDLRSIWLNFEETLTPYQSELFNRAYNLISLILKDNILPITITTILSDNSLETTTKINIVRKTLLENLIDLLSELGIIIDKEYVTLDSLADICNIADVLFSIDEVEDVLGLIDILDNATYDNKEKLITVILRWLSLDDEGDLPYIIHEVSADVIKGIYIGLGVFSEDDGDYVNPDVAKRIKENKDFLAGTLANTHIINGGGVGLSFVLLSNMFVNELGEILLNDNKKYLTEIMGLSLISSQTNIEIQEGFEVLIKDFSEDIDDIYLGSKILEKVVL